MTTKGNDGARGTELPGILRTFPVFSRLGEAALASLATSMIPHNWAAGRLLFQRGDPGDHLIAITKGKVRLSLASAQGKELVLGHVGATEVLGELSLIDGMPRSAEATAVESTSGLILRRVAFESAVERHPDILMALARVVCSLLRRADYQMESIALYELQGRLVRFILLTLVQRYGDDLPPEPALRLGMNQSDLSAMLGASRPKVNQAMQALIATGAIRRSGDVLLCDAVALQDLAEAIGD